MYTSGLPDLCYKTRPISRAGRTHIQQRTLIPLITAAIIYDNIASSTSRFIFYNNNSNLKIISVNRLSLCRLGPVEGCGCCRHSKLKLAELCVHQCVIPPHPKKQLSFTFKPTNVKILLATADQLPSLLFNGPSDGYGYVESWCAVQLVRQDVAIVSQLMKHFWKTVLFTQLVRACFMFFCLKI